MGRKPLPFDKKRQSVSLALNEYTDASYHIENFNHLVEQKLCEYLQIEYIPPEPRKSKRIRRTITLPSRVYKRLYEFDEELNLSEFARDIVIKEMKDKI